MRKGKRQARLPSAHDRLLRLQRRTYRALELEAASLLGPELEDIRSYRRQNERDFRGRAQLSTKKELITAIRGHDVTFIADYHTFGQAQRTALRLMREVVRPGEHWALALELISSQHQRALDDYQAKRIGTDEFHSLIRYREEWGFPWKNYEPLFTWARDHGVRLIALNRPRALLYRALARGSDGARISPSSRDVQDLPARDEWAAGILTDLIVEQPDLRVLALYGGHHVGRKHLPGQLTRISRAFLGRPLSALSVHQNHPELYWKLARTGREMDAQVVRLRSKDAYCVLSATPWAQLQSFVSGLEGDDLEIETLEEREAGADYLSLMGAYGTVISELLGLERVSFGSLTIKTIEEADFLDDPPMRQGLSASEARLARALVQANERFYLPQAQIAYLAAPSPNAAAELAAIYCLRYLAPHEAFSRGTREDFFRLALESAFGFLGSLLVNPKRKCDLPRDHERRLQDLSRGVPPTFAGEREARKLALAVLSAGSLGAVSRERALTRLFAREFRSGANAFVTFFAARAVGRVLAKRLHPVLLSFRQGSPELGHVAALFLSQGCAEKGYITIIEISGARRARATASKSEAI